MFLSLEKLKTVYDSDLYPTKSMAYLVINMEKLKIKN